MTDDLFSSPPSIPTAPASGLRGGHQAAQRESVNAGTEHGVHLSPAMGGNTGQPRGPYRGGGTCRHCGNLGKGEIMVPYASGESAHLDCYRRHAEAVARGEAGW